MKRNILLFALLALLLFGGPAGADRFTFVSLEFPPLEYAGEDKAATGIAVEMVTEVMRSLGHTVEIKIFPWARSLQMVKEGQADAIFTAYKNPERETFLDYSNQVLIPQIIGLYVKKGSGIQFDGNLTALKGKRFGVVSTISYGTRFDDAKAELQVERVEKLELNFEKLLAGRIDVIPSNIYTGDYTLGKMQLGDKIVRLEKEIDNVPSYIAFSKARNLSALRDQFDQALIKFKDGGAYTDLLKKYGIGSK